jgi:hypothetical protein
MKAIHSYPKVLNIGHRYIQDLFNGTWHIEEKVDGSQISFGEIDTELFVRSKGQMLVTDAPEKMFASGVEAIKAVQDKLRENWIYRGEYLQKPKHNALTYDRIPDNHIIIFDIETEPNNFLSPEEKKAECKRLGFECIPQIEIPQERGLASEWIPPLLDRDSVLGGQKIEGVVIKNYTRITPDGKFMVGKFVSEAFKERHDKEWKKANPTKKDVLQELVESLKTEARYNKAIQHLKEKGVLTNTPKDIGNLLKEIHKDIIEEESEYIKDTLYKHSIGHIKRGVCGGFPEWYKTKLLDGDV